MKRIAAVMRGCFSHQVTAVEPSAPATERHEAAATDPIAPRIGQVFLIGDG